MTKFLTIALMTALTVTAEVHGQTAPSPQEVAQYTGLHLAAHRGNIASIEQLAASGADVNARDCLTSGSAAVKVLMTPTKGCQ